MENQGTTQEGAPDLEATFQGLFDQGAFEPQKDVDTNVDTSEETPEVEQKAEPEEAEPEVKETENTEEDNTEEYSTLDDLIKAKGIDPESVRSLPVTVKIDGEEKQVPLSEVLKSYQLEGHVNNKSIELSNQQKQFQAEQEAARTLISKQLQETKQLGDLAQQQLNYEYQNVDWNGLRQADPGQYAALQVEFQQRQNQIKEYLGQIGEQERAALEQSQAESAQKIESEKQRMFEKHPEWKDPAAFASARETISNYAKTLGYSDAELAQVQDHRLIDVLHDAASFRTLQAAKPEALKQVRAAPKMGKPGTRNVTDPQQAKRQQAVDKFNANPNDIDAQAALFDVLAA